MTDGGPADAHARVGRRIPLFSRATTCVGGLMLWIGYLLLDQKRLTWATVAALGAVAVLGLIMAARWIRVYRAVSNPGPSLTRNAIVPPERNFRCRSSSCTASWPSPPTLVLVLFTALGGVSR